MLCPKVTEGYRQELLTSVHQARNKRSFRVAVQLRLFCSGPEGGIPPAVRRRTSTVSDSLAFTSMCTRPSQRLLVCDVSSI